MTAKVKPLSGRIDVPAIIQMEAVECGAASLAMVLAYYGRFVPLEELRVECGISRDGSKAGNILKAARKYGLAAKGYKEEIETLGSHPLPMILFWNFCHFVVLTGRSGGKYYINDPASGAKVVSAREFDNCFTGVVLTFVPGPDFSRGGKPKGVFVALGKRLHGAYLGILFSILAGLLLVLPGLMVPAFQRVLIDQILIDGYFHWFYPLIWIMALTLLIRGGLTWYQQQCLLKIDMKLSLTSSAKFFYHVLRLPIEFFTQRYPGEIGNRVYLNDKVATLLSDKLATNLLNLLMIGFYAAVMYKYDRVLTLISVSMAVLNFGVLNYVSKKRVLLNQSIQQEQGKLIGTSMSGLQLIETLKATGSESDFFSMWAGYQAKLNKAEQKMELSSIWLMSIPDLLTSLNTALILVIGSLRVIGGEMSIGMLMAYQTIMMLFMLPVNQMVELGGKLQEIKVDLERLDDVLKYKKDTQFEKEEAERSYTPPLIKSNGSEKRLDGYLELKNVAFGYNITQPPIIENFNLSLKPGDRVALVGGSGSGKSTVAKLIAGLYKPWQGEILFDGKPRHDYDMHILNSSFSIVDQDIFIFEGSIKDNITMWDDTIDSNQVLMAAKDAQIHEDITSRPGGYNGQVEEGGRNFSGGQRQRLEIARALVTNPTILVMDEATSALDPKTEKNIDNYIRRRGCTCLIVAHRLSTIRDSNEIVVMDQGRIVERGTHDELIERQGHYYRLIQMH